MVSELWGLGGHLAQGPQLCPEPPLPPRLSLQQVLLLCAGILVMVLLSVCIE